MSVKVDEAIHFFKGGLWCHMMADSLEELETFARKLGLHKNWLQGSDEFHMHYDLSPKMRDRALKLGAEFVPAKVQAKARIETMRTKAAEEGGA